MLEKNKNDPTVEKLVEYEAERGKIVQSFDISSKRRAIIVGSNKGLESLYLRKHDLFTLSHCIQRNPRETLDKVN